MGRVAETLHRRTREAIAAVDAFDLEDETNI